jgi:hypothetical protein
MPIPGKVRASRNRIFRGVDDPSRVFVSVEYPSADDAKSFRERLKESAVLANFTLVLEPTLAELEEEVEY